MSVSILQYDRRILINGWRGELMSVVASSLFTKFDELICSSMVRAPDSTHGITGSIPTVAIFLLHFFLFSKGNEFQF